MINYYISEKMKYKRTGLIKMLWIVPILTGLIGIGLMFNYQCQYFSYNMWYITFLPFMVALISASMISKEKKYLFHGLFAVIEDKKKIWVAKVLVGAVMIIGTSLIMACVIAVMNMLYGGVGISIAKNMIAMLILILCYIWQVPVFMLLTKYTNSIFSIFVCVAVNMICIIELSLKNVWWIPFAIPARLMCSVLGIYPNGLMIEEGNQLLYENKSVTGVLICVTMFVISLVITTKIFEKSECA